MVVKHQKQCQVAARIIQVYRKAVHGIHSLIIFEHIADG